MLFEGRVGPEEHVELGLVADAGLALVEGIFDELDLVEVGLRVP